ncbi:MAG: ATP-dependent DNA ligase [Fimbriimonadaceae bacterium]|jgi:DNA ligase-1|nr:ATP-dependent DNA ligase [Fimbriimonadaceae bacterium]
MRAFVNLYLALDATTKTSEKHAAMKDYFRTCSDEDAAWALYFLSGRRVKGLVKRSALKGATLSLTGLPEWLYDECREIVGDTAETISHLNASQENRTLEAQENPAKNQQKTLSQVVQEIIIPLGQQDQVQQEEVLEATWRSQTQQEVFVFTKLITGALRVGVSQELVLRALGEVLGVPPEVLAHRLMGNWTPEPSLLATLKEEAVESRKFWHQPYPFCLAHPLPDLSALGDVTQWAAEWKWDGIRAQVVKREGKVSIWSRGQELLNESFPDLATEALSLGDGCVIDGEILAYRDGILPFQDLQKRLGRKNPGKKLLAEIPIHFFAFDLLEWEGEDLRQRPFCRRREMLELHHQTNPAFGISPLVHIKATDELLEMRDRARDKQAEGLMIKRLDSPYEVGRKTGTWWKWKVQPFTVDCVLIFAQRGTGRRANLYTDYTFGVWSGEKLVTLCKAYSGLTDEEIVKVDRFVRQNTLEKFGPVRTVKPELVFEIAFEGIQFSSRHKSGIAVRFPRIQRWRTDKKPEDAEKLEQVKDLLRQREV